VVMSKKRKKTKKKDLGNLKRENPKIDGRGGEWERGPSWGTEKRKRGFVNGTFGKGHDVKGGISKSWEKKGRRWGGMDSGEVAKSYCSLWRGPGEKNKRGRIWEPGKGPVVIYWSKKKWGGKRHKKTGWGV